MSTPPADAQTPEEVAERLAVSCGCLASDAQAAIAAALRAALDAETSRVAALLRNSAKVWRLRAVSFDSCCDAEKADAAERIANYLSPEP